MDYRDDDAGDDDVRLQNGSNRGAHTLHDVFVVVVPHCSMIGLLEPHCVALSCAAADLFDGCLRMLFPTSCVGRTPRCCF